MAAWTLSVPTPSVKDITKLPDNFYKGCYVPGYYVVLLGNPATEVRYHMQHIDTTYGIMGNQSTAFALPKHDWIHMVCDMDDKEVGIAVRSSGKFSFLKVNTQTGVVRTMSDTWTPKTPFNGPIWTERDWTMTLFASGVSSIYDGIPTEIVIYDFLSEGMLTNSNFTDCKGSNATWLSLMRRPYTGQYFGVQQYTEVGSVFLAMTNFARTYIGDVPLTLDTNLFAVDASYIYAWARKNSQPVYLRWDVRYPGQVYTSSPYTGTGLYPQQTQWVMA
jgi:hypothetical protein